MLHRGEIVEQRVRNSDLKITKIAAALHITRNTLYVRFQTPDLDLDFIKKVGKIINYDFGNDFPELRSVPPYQEVSRLNSTLADESTSEYMSLSECTKALFNLQKKYINLLEQYNETLFEAFNTGGKQLKKANK